MDSHPGTETAEVRDIWAFVEDITVAACDRVECVLYDHLEGKLDDVLDKAVTLYIESDVIMEVWDDVGNTVTITKGEFRDAARQ